MLPVLFGSVLAQDSILQKWAHGIHRHPQAIKISGIANLAIGTALAAVRYIFPTISPMAAIGLSLVGRWQVVAGIISLAAMDMMVPLHHDMKDHAYRPGKCEGGELYYHGDVPVLSLDADDPYKAGSAHGYLCGQAISTLVRRFNCVFHTLFSERRARDLPASFFEQIRRHIPNAYLVEMQGLLDGYNR